MSDCTEKKKRGTVRVRGSQIEIIVDTMEKNIFLREGKLHNFYTASKRNSDWEELAQKLNSSGGAVKNIKSWQKCWSDKKDVKKRSSVIKAARLSTGGRSVEVKPLTPLEERILNLIGSEVAEGLVVEESDALNHEYIIPTMAEHDSVCLSPFSVLTSTEDLDAFNCTLPDTDAADSVPATQSVENFSPSIPPMTQTPRSTPQLRDGRLPSHKEKLRTKPVILKSQHSQKMVDGTVDVASALKRCAGAMEKHNELQETDLILKKQKVDAMGKKII